MYPTVERLPAGDTDTNIDILMTGMCLEKSRYTTALSHTAMETGKYALIDLSIATNKMFL